MQDIDFDELDKAVSSVLSKDSQPQDSVVSEPTAPAAPVVSSPTSATVAAEVSEPAVDEVSTSTPPAEPSTENVVAAPSLATKRRGKFMDVVHPSSDMNPSAEQPAPATAPRTTLQPLSSDVTPDAPSSDETPPSEVGDVAGPDQVSDTSSISSTATDAQVATPPVVDDNPPADTAMPEGAPEPTPVAEQSEVNPADAGTTSESQDTVATDSPAETELEAGSPFIPDAQVDKRPLGAFGEVDQSPDVVDAGAETPSDPSVMPQMPQTVPQQPVPRELQPDVVEAEKTVDETVDAAEQQVEDATNTGVSSDTGVPAPEGKQESKPENDAHPLFDTTTYHQPIDESAHKKAKPAWVWWLVGFVACLGVGAGVGYFMFMSGF